MSSTQQAVRKVLLLIAYTEEETGARKWSDLLKVTRIVRGRHTGQVIEFVAQKSSYLIQQIPSLSYSLGVSWPFCSFIYVLKSAFNFHEKKNPIGMNWNCTESAVQWGENDIFLASNFLFVNTCSLSICLDRIQCLSIRFYNFLL